MDPERITFFQNHSATVSTLLRDIEAFRGELRKTLQQVAGMIDTTTFPYPIQQDFWRNGTDLYDILHYAITVHATLDVQITVNLSPHGWRISLFTNRGERAAFEAWLTQRQIITRLRSSEPYRLGYGSDDLNYQAALLAVQTRVQHLLAQIGSAPDEHRLPH